MIRHWLVVSPGHGGCSSRTLRGLAWATLVAVVVLSYQLWGGRYPAPLRLADEDMAILKGSIALLGFALSAGEAYARRRGRPLPAWAVRGAAGALAAAAVGAYLYSEQAPGFSYNRWELFHHYVGAKYQPELGYERIYRCTAVAESEMGPLRRAEVRLRRLRDLATNRRTTTDAALAQPDLCKAHFSPERWSAFKVDIAFFRAQSEPLYWERIQEDHGYNAPPLWTAQAKLLASLIPATGPGLSTLACIDPLLLVGMFFALWWAFGWRVVCAALVFWATVLPGHEVFTAGAMLRQDWLFWTVLSACLLRRRHPFLAGGALATASLLRIFPGFLFAGWLAAAVTHRLRRHRFLRAHVHAFAGALVLGVGLALVSAAAAGPGAYGEFVTHLMRRYQNTPLTNDMGLPQILAYRPQGRVVRTVDYRLIDPYSKWITMQLEARESRRPLRYALIGALAVVFLLVTARLRTLWIAQALSLVWLVAAVPLPCYYYGVLMLAAILGVVHRRYERALLLVAGASAFLAACPWLSDFWDDAYFAQSVLFLGFTVGLLLAFVRRRRLRVPGPPRPADSSACARP